MEKKLVTPQSYFFLKTSCAVLLLCACLSGCSKKSGDTLPQQQPPTVEVITLSYTNYQGYAKIAGNLESPATVNFQAQVSGYLKSAPTREGLMVETNDILFEIDPSTYLAAREATQAQLLIDQARAAKADADLVRNEELMAQEVISKAQYDVYVASAKESKAAVELSKAKLETAEINLGFTKIYAPYRGLLGEVAVRPGILVSAGITQLGSMGVIDPIWVTFPLSEQAYLRGTKDGVFETAAKALPEKLNLEADNWLRVELILADNSLYPEKGRIIFVDREFSSTTGTLKVKVEFPNPNGHLRPNQFAQVRLPYRLFTDVFVIPQSAIMQLQSKAMAYVVGQENKVQMRALDVALFDDNQAIIKGGLNPGERLVVKGLLKLRNGITVTPMTAEESAALAQKMKANLAQ